MLRVAVRRTQDAPEAAADPPPGWMGDSERRRWGQLAPKARRDFIASRSLLRTLLPQGDWDVSADAGTAPVARAVDATAVPASLSHRLGWVAAAIADARVGVDIECERPSRSDADERAALMLAPAELPDWQAVPAEARAAALLTRWTAKEAWFKASQPGTAPWDFRQVVARACPPAQANVRVWAAPPLHVAVCAASPLDLAGARCEGLDAATASSTFWHVARAASAA